MTAPLLATRDALVRELERHLGAHASIVANNLLASGVLCDPATLADDLCKRLCDLAGESRLFIPGEIRAALAAALTEDPS